MPFARRNRAFTLIELLVVVLIIGILVAVAAPSFLGQQSKAQNSAVEQQLAVSLKEAKAIWTNGAQSGFPSTLCSTGPGTCNDTSGPSLDGLLKASEPEYSYAAGGASATNSLIDAWYPGAPSDYNTIAFCTQSASTIVFCVEAQEAQGGLTSNVDATDTDPFGVSSAAAAGGANVVYVTGHSEFDAHCAVQAAYDNKLVSQESGCSGLTGGAGGGYTISTTGWVQLAAPGTLVTTSLPINNAPPALTGTAWVGQTLTGSPGTWSGSPSSYTYQWVDCTSALETSCSNATGAGNSGTTTGASVGYQIQSSDNGSYVAVEFNATNAGGTSPYALSTTTAQVIGTPSDSTPPALTGNAYVGQTLTGSPGSWTGNPTSYTYQWLDCTSTAETNCPNATGAGNSGTSTGASVNYQLQSSDHGAFIAVEFKATNAAGPSSYALSATTTAQVIATPVNTLAPKLSGDAQEGQTISVSNGTWTDSPSTYIYTWQKCTGAGTGCSTIANAASSYLLPAGSAGYYYQATVAAGNAAGTASAVTSSNNSGAVAESYAEQVMTATGSNTAPFDYWSMDSASTANSVSGSTGALSWGTDSTVTGPIASDPNSDGVAISNYGVQLPDSNSSSCSYTAAGVPVLADGGATTGCIANTTTVELWFKTTGSGIIIGQQSASAPCGGCMQGSLGGGWVPNLWVGTDGKLYGMLYSYPIVNTTITVNDGNWHYVMLSISGTTETLWLDGNLIGSATGAWVQYPSYPMVYSQMGEGYTSSYYTNSGSGWVFFNGDVSALALYGWGANFTSAQASVVAAHYKAANPANFAIH